MDQKPEYTLYCHNNPMVEAWHLGPTIPGSAFPVAGVINDLSIDGEILLPCKQGKPRAATGLSHPFLGMGPGPLELGKIASFRLKLGKSITFYA